MPSETASTSGSEGSPAPAAGTAGETTAPPAVAAAPAVGPTPVPASGPVQGAKDTGPHYTPQPGSKKYKRVGDYDIVSKLGQGAMGSVYLAKRVSTGQLVALKILPPDLAKDQELLERFRREARASQRLTHPNIVSAVEFGQVDKYHY